MWTRLDYRLFATVVLIWRHRQGRGDSKSGLTSVMTGAGKQIAHLWPIQLMRQVYPATCTTTSLQILSFRADVWWIASRWYLTPDDTDLSDTWVHIIEYHFWTFSPSLFLYGVTYYRIQILFQWKVSKDEKRSALICSWCFCHDFFLNLSVSSLVGDQNTGSDIWTK